MAETSGRVDSLDLDLNPSRLVDDLINSVRTVRFHLCPGMCANQANGDIQLHRVLKSSFASQVNAYTADCFDELERYACPLCTYRSSH